MTEKYSYEDLLKIIETLRSENGCPWDREQTHISLLSSLVEETYELKEAIEIKDDHLMQEELGDVLLQIVMHSQIAKEERRFTMEDVVDGIASKMVHRHPHVFNKELGVEAQTADEVLVQWEEIKKQEKKEESVSQSMERVAKTLPALIRTQKIQKKAIKAEELNVDKIEQINGLIKLLEALKYEDLQQENKDLEDQIGKILFEVVKLATFFDINAEFTLTKFLEKFINRFRYIENSRFTED